MEIIDLQTEEKFLFIISCWLAVDKADGIVDCIIPVSGEEELQLPIYQQTRRDLHLVFNLCSTPTVSVH